MPFKDHFSGHASDYAKFRPHYPRDLFAYLAEIAPERKCAWDCATGNGQAAIALTEFFQNVVATDASETQIANGQPHDRITYRVASAERSELPSAAVDLITATQNLAMDILGPLPSARPAFAAHDTLVP